LYTDFIQKKLDNGINLYIYPTNKFKTVTVKVYIHQRLDRDTATQTALLPFVISRGCKMLPTSQKITGYMEQLYGAGFDVDILKKGERQIIDFGFDVIDSKFIPGEDNLLSKGLKTLKEIITKPVEKDGGFDKEYLNQEKDVLKRTIESLFNNKMQYAVERCFQEMCKNEDYSIYKYGKVEDLSKIDAVNLYKYYMEMLRTNPIDIFIMGNVDPEDIFEIISSEFGYDRNSEKEINDPLVNVDVDEPKTIIERQKVNQGKLSLGLRTYTTFKDDDYYSMVVANGILGGGAHSKLFQNVREKASLAYYAFSRLEKIKGLMIIASGIEFENFNRAFDIINRQIDDLKQGSISDTEFNATRKAIINSLREASDDPFATISLYLDGIISKNIDDIGEMISKIEAVQKTDVVKAAQKLKLDTVYFLTTETGVEQ
jgi:predicted Zn-dependent peptidase